MAPDTGPTFHGPLCVAATVPVTVAVEARATGPEIWTCVPLWLATLKGPVPAFAVTVPDTGWVLGNALTNTVGLLETVTGHAPDCVTA
jgi:hypothetical protein